MADLISAASRGKRAKPMSRQGTAGVAVHGGYIVDGEKNPELRGQRKFKTYSELLANVEICASSVRYILNLIGKAQWTVEPADDSRRAAEIAEAVESMMYDMERPWHRVVRRAAMYRVYGYSWQEWIAKRRPDGLIGYLDIEPRSQATITRWDVDEAGIVHGVVQESPQTFRELYLPRAKAIYVVDDTISDSPEGLGLLRHVAPAASRMQAYERLEGNSYETDLRGVPVGRAPYARIDELTQEGKLSKTEAAQMTAVIESFVTDHVRGSTTGLVLDSSVYTSDGEDSSPSTAELWGVELLKSGSTGQEAVANAIMRLTRSIARVFGTEGLLLGENGGGSYALAKDKSASVGLIVDGSLVEIAESFEKDYLRPLAALNGWPVELLPTLKTEKLQHREVTEITEALEGLSRAGAPLLPDDPAINVVRESLGLPEQETITLDLEESLIGRRGRGEGKGDGDQPKPKDGDSEAADDAASASQDTIDTE